ncbi:MAG: D-sedoheptulose-7-phosphate isomerase [Acidobacteriaceae bacterium]
MNPVVSGNLRDAIATLNQAASLESEMIAAADAISKALISGEKLMACGNGGSAADASHLTTEFVCRFNQDRRPYPAISLAAHGGDLTAIGNDYEFNEIFARQVQAFGKPGDVLTAFTGSGRSENVRRALVAAKDMKIETIAFLGRDGGTCAGLADIELLVPGSVIARIQEGHQFLFHTICEMVEERLQTQG